MATYQMKQQAALSEIANAAIDDDVIEVHSHVITDSVDKIDEYEESEKTKEKDAVNTVEEASIIDVPYSESLEELEADFLDEDSEITILTESYAEATKRYDEIANGITATQAIDRGTAETIKTYADAEGVELPPINSFTTHPSRQNIEVSLEAIDRLKQSKGGAIGGAIVKIINWIRAIFEKWQGKSAAIVEEQTRMRNLMDSLEGKQTEVKSINELNKDSIKEIGEEMSTKYRSFDWCKKLEGGSLIEPSRITQEIYEKVSTRHYSNLVVATMNKKPGGVLRYIEVSKWTLGAVKQLDDIHEKLLTDITNKSLKPLDTYRIKDDLSDVVTKSADSDGSNKDIAKEFYNHTVMSSKKSSGSKMPTLNAALNFDYRLLELDDIDRSIQKQLASINKKFNRLLKEFNNLDGKDGFNSDVKKVINALLQDWSTVNSMMRSVLMAKTTTANWIKSLGHSVKVTNKVYTKLIQARSSKSKY